MNNRKIFALQRKTQAEAQKAVNKIYKKYSKEMEKLIVAEVPKGLTMIMGNGMVWLQDKEGNEVSSGKAWGLSKGEEQLSKLATLQYSDNLCGNFDLPKKITVI